MYLIAFPLLLIPFVLYHMVTFLLGLPLETAVFSVPVLSGMRVGVTIGETLVMLAVLLLSVEVVKFTRHVPKGAMDHILSLILFGVMVFEFMVLPQAATGTFLVLITLSFVDLVGGFSFGARKLPLHQSGPI